MIAGIDPSLSGTGYSDGRELLTITTQAADPFRLAVIHDAISSLVARRCRLAVLEDLPTHAHGAGKTGMAQGVIRLALIRQRVHYITVSPSIVKKLATGKGNATKPDMRMALYQRAGLDVRDDNQVDAWWLRQIGMQLLAHPDRLDLPKTHLAALAKIPTLERN